MRYGTRFRPILVSFLIMMLTLVMIVDSNNLTSNSHIINPSKDTSESEILKIAQINSTEITNTNNSFIGGDMVKRFDVLNHSSMKINVLASNLSCSEGVLAVSSQYSVIPTLSPEDFYDSLNSSDIAAVLESGLEGIPDTERLGVTTGLIRWVDEGNLLVLNDMSILNEETCRSLGIDVSETKIDITSSCQVQFESPNPLTHNMLWRDFLFEEFPTCFSITNTQISEAVAFVEDSNENQKLPCVVLSSLGKGFVLTIGCNLSSMKSSELPSFRRILENLFEMYGTVHFSFRTESFPILDPSSPHLHIMQENDSLLIKMKEAIFSLCSLGFNAFGSNLLYADYNGGYYGYVSFHGGLKSFIRVFTSCIRIEYDGAPHITLSNTIIPSSYSDIFSEVEPLPVATLCWPSGWDPPDVSYYHLSPTKQYTYDMGSDQWTPQSVEEVLRAHDARNLGPAGDDVKVAIVDSGFSHNRPGDPNNPDYPTELGYHPYYEEYWRYKELLEFRYTAHWAGGHDPDEDTNGHGTAMASNLFAVAPDMTFHFVPYYDKVDAFNVLLSINPDVVTCSWSYYGGSIPQNPTLQSQIRQLTENGAIVIFAAGNGHYNKFWPSTEPCVVSVGGAYVDSNGNFEASNYATSAMEPAFNGRTIPDICGIVGQQPIANLIEMPTEPESGMDETNDGTGDTDGWFVGSGTSAAAPQVAGLAALMKELEPGLSVGRFKHIAMTTCTDIITGESSMGDEATIGFDLATGAGLIDCYRAIETMIDYSSSDIYEPKTEPDEKFINFYSFTGTYGLSYHADTVGSTQSGYYFFGYLISRNGAVMTRQWDGSAGWFRISGWFRQYDTFSPSLQPDRRYLNAYILSVDGNEIIKSVRILDHDDGTNWKYIDTVVTGLPENGMIRIAFGRRDSWNTDYELTAEWANVGIYSYDQWNPDTIPVGDYYGWGSSIAPEPYLGNTYRIDTIGNDQYGYHFFGYASDYNPFLGPYTEISIAGWFRQYDTFSPSLQSGRRYLRIYVIDRLSQPWTVKASFKILDYYDGTDWVYRRQVLKMPSNLPANYYYIAIGRHDSWSADWCLTGEWSNIQLLVSLSS